MVRRSTRVVGNDAELLALRFLRSAGLQPITRNYHCRLGEIDLVMRDGDCIVFVEVRYRSARSLSPAALTVDARKQQRLCRTADLFLTTRPDLADCKARFDVVGIDRAEDGEASIEWLQDAFWP